jgi:hypothetical protein
MKNQITDIERNTILEMHISKGYKTFNVDEIVKSSLVEQYTTSNITAIQNALINAGENVGPRGADGDYGTNTRNAVKSFQRKNGLKDDGVVGPCTAKVLGVKSLQGGNVCSDTSVKQKVSSDSTKTKISPDSSKLKTGQGLTDGKKYDCIGITKEQCSSLTKRGGDIGTGGKDEGCAKYMRVCLQQLDSKLIGGDAWKLLPILIGQGGKEVYNMFSQDMDFNKLSNQFKGKNVTSLCAIHKNKGEGHDKEDSTFKTIVKNNYPNKTKMSISNLKLGDIVGLYWRDSGNFGKAFCERGLKDGKIKNEPFSLNTHVGFVGAIKDGMPLIFHSVHSKRLATPASDLMNKNQQGMITWVVQDPDIYAAANIGKNKPEEEKSWWSDLFNKEIKSS